MLTAPHGTPGHKAQGEPDRGKHAVSCLCKELLVTSVFHGSDRDTGPQGWVRGQMQRETMGSTEYISPPRPPGSGVTGQGQACIKTEMPPGEESSFDGGKLKSGGICYQSESQGETLLRTRVGLLTP